MFASPMQRAFKFPLHPNPPLGNVVDKVKQMPHAPPGGCIHTFGTGEGNTNTLAVELLVDPLVPILKAMSVKPRDKRLAVSFALELVGLAVSHLFSHILYP
jgi:hypothetical protein